VESREWLKVFTQIVAKIYLFVKRTGRFSRRWISYNNISLALMPFRGLINWNAKG